MDAVAPGLGADIDHRIADARGRRIENLVGARDADRHRVDQNVAVIARMEIALAADRRHADAIAIAADAGDDARDEMPGLGMIGRAEAQRVEIGDRPRAHGEDVAQDAADAGRGALIGLDEGWMVVGFHLEDRRPGRRRYRPRRHSRPARRSRAARWSAGRAAIFATTCRSNARSTSPRRCRARSGLARAP